MSDFTWYQCPSRVVMGVGSHAEIAQVVGQLGCTRMFLAVDAALVGGELYESVCAILQRCGVETAIFTEIEPEPSVATVNKAFEVARRLGADSVLALGGGSTIDVAKAVAILSTNGGRIEDYEGSDRFDKRPLPRIAIPTTAGTGSEVSGSAVITDTERNRKMSVRHARLNPADVAILDPLAVRTLPASVATHAGIDAFVHAFEAYVSRLANPITDALNLQAIELLSQNLRAFVADRTDLKAGQAMLCGSTLTGMTFGITGVGNVHCMARFIGAELHVPHGLANALALRAVAAFNRPAAEDKFARVAKAMGLRVDDCSTAQAAVQAVQAIATLCGDLRIPRGLRDVGASPAMLPALARQCSEAGYERWNPRPTSYADFLNLFETSY